MWKSLSCVQLFMMPWTIQSMEFSRSNGGRSHSLLQGIFPTQGLNPGLPQCTRILYQLSHRGSPRILEWAACPFCSGSSWSRIRSRSPTLQAGSTPAGPPGEPCYYVLRCICTISTSRAKQSTQQKQMSRGHGATDRLLFF